MTKDQDIQNFLNAARQSLEGGQYVKITLGHYKGADATLKKIGIKKILIKGQEKLSFTYTHKTRDIVKNYEVEDGLREIETALAQGFHMASLFTTEFDLTLDTASKNPTLSRKAPSHTEVPSADHDRSKNRLIEAAPEKAYLHHLKITDAKGEVYKNAQDKFRQINKYVEILSTYIKAMPADHVKNIVDMGSGKGYLTFALYDYLTSVLHLKPHVAGVEYRQDMVDLCNKIAAQSGFEGLSFVQGAIEEYDSTKANILIALHACDTATDDAIYKGITAQADLIVVAPCCHKQIRREIEKGHAHNDLDFLTQHGIFLERQAEMVTDGLRALILTYFGYTTKVFEFISDAHTPKNVLIVGTRNPKLRHKDPKILENITAAKDYFGIGQHHLEKKMGI